MTTKSDKTPEPEKAAPAPPETPQGGIDVNIRAVSARAGGPAPDVVTNNVGLPAEGAPVSGALPVQPRPILPPAKERAAKRGLIRRTVAWIWQERAWLFSGLGVTLILALLPYTQQCGADEPRTPPMPSPTAVVEASPLPPTPSLSPSPAPTPRPVQARSGKRATQPPVIYDLLVEARLICNAPDGGAVEESGAGSPAEAPYLEGDAGYEELRLQQPVRVLRSGGTATLVNRFGMQEGSALRGSPTTFLLGFRHLHLPIVVCTTPHWQCSSINAYEVAVQLNGREFWSTRQFYGCRPWQGGGGFDVPLEQLHAKITERNP